VSQSSGSEVVDPTVVDTDVLSFWQKTDTRGAEYARILAGRTLIISFQTVAEQLRWAEERNWGDQRRRELEDFLKRFLVQPYSIDLAREWATLMASMGKAGHPMASGDGWIAATALLVGAPLATHNRRDFESIPSLTIISFAPPRSQA
jgi:predicted nucleic acid-binding protein